MYTVKQTFSQKTNVPTLVAVKFCFINVSIVITNTPVGAIMMSSLNSPISAHKSQHSNFIFSVIDMSSESSVCLMGYNDCLVFLFLSFTFFEMEILVLMDFKC